MFKFALLTLKNHQMKTSILILSAILLFSFTAFGQTGKDVPAPVKSAFSQKFSKAANVKWTRENDKEWEAEFKMDGKDYSANFDNAGIWMETEYKISSKEIPASVTASIGKEFAGYKTDVSEVSETEKGKVYEFVLSKGKEKMEAAFSSDGKLLNKELVKEDNEKEEK
ncbi:MAG: PepSY-like domain-containing protein [Bacteroidales bacterium]